MPQNEVVHTEAPSGAFIEAADDLGSIVFSDGDPTSAPTLKDSHSIRFATKMGSSGFLDSKSHLAFIRGNQLESTH